jgi:hypothetical protein
LWKEIAMSDTPSRLPARPSLEHLRKQAKERLADLRTANPETTLAKAQFQLAREYGFDSWPRLVHHVEARQSSPHGLSAAPPFYQIDWKNNSISVWQPLSDHEWDRIFDVMRELQLTGLNAGGHMTDAALGRFSRLDRVTYLDLDGSTAVTDEGLAHLARMPQLEDLNVSGWHSAVTDRGLAVLQHLKRLRRFQMSWPQQVTDAGIAHLRDCSHLQSVNLMGTHTGDGAVQALAGKPALREFRSGRGVTDAGLLLLHEFPIFKTWHGGEVQYALMSPDASPNHLLIDGPFTNRGLASLVGLDVLFGLTMFWHSQSFDADGLASLAQLPRLGFLSCAGEMCDDVAMRHIAAMPHLRMLLAQGTIATDAGFGVLSRSQSIEYIWGRECPNLGTQGFVALAAMPALRGLAVSCKSVGDDALASLPRFPALRELMPMDVQDDGFRHVGRCDALEALWCMYCRDTTDLATGHVAGLSRLTTYYAGQTKITDRSLETLGTMTSLERVRLWNTPGVTNAGIAALARLPRLREVGLEMLSGVTREAAALFPPHVHVTFWNR